MTCHLKSTMILLSLLPSHLTKQHSSSLMMENDGEDELMIRLKPKVIDSRELFSPMSINAAPLNTPSVAPVHPVQNVLVEDSSTGKLIIMKCLLGLFVPPTQQQSISFMRGTYPSALARHLLLNSIDKNPNVFKGNQLSILLAEKVGSSSELMMKTPELLEHLSNGNNSIFDFAAVFDTFLPLMTQISIASPLIKAITKILVYLGQKCQLKMVLVELILRLLEKLIEN